MRRQKAEHYRAVEKVPRKTAVVALEGELVERNGSVRRSTYGYGVPARCENVRPAEVYVES